MPWLQRRWRTHTVMNRQMRTDKQYGNWYKPLTGGLLHLVQRGGPGRAVAPPSPLLAVPNVTAHPSMAIEPASSPVPIKGLIQQ